MSTAKVEPWMVGAAFEQHLLRLKIDSTVRLGDQSAQTQREVYRHAVIIARHYEAYMTKAPETEVKK